MKKTTRKQPRIQPHAFEPFARGSMPHISSNSTNGPNCVQLLTVGILQTYRNCNPSFRYLSSANPRRVITKPSQGVSNNNYDNINSDLIFYVNDVLGLQQKHKYLVLDLLGQGTFGQVVKCKRLDTGELLAVKAVKNRPAYFNQGMFEVHILEQLNSRFDPDLYNIVQLKDYFIDRQHLCLVFELLSVNMFDLIKQNRYRGLSTNLIRVFLRQILKTLRSLQECGIIHCDLKPENILLRNQTSPQIKLIDFGSACYEHQTVYTYIQSRFYRSPEVIIGYPYNAAIDMWSLGCIAAELFLGLPLFPGHNEYNQLIRIMDTQGELPEALLKQGKFTSKFYTKTQTEGGSVLHLKSEEQYCQEQNAEQKPYKKYFHSTKLADIIQNYRYKKNLTEEQLQKEQRTRVAFTDFLSGLLKLDPVERWTAEQASGHPFITGEPFSGNWTPPPRKSREPAPIVPPVNTAALRSWGSPAAYPPFAAVPQMPFISEHSTYLPASASISQPNIEATTSSLLYPEHSAQQKIRRSRSISVDTKRSLKQHQNPSEQRQTNDSRLPRGQPAHKVQQRGNQHHSSNPPVGKAALYEKRNRTQGKPGVPSVTVSPTKKEHRRSRSNEQTQPDLPAVPQSKNTAGKGPIESRPGLEVKSVHSHSHLPLGPHQASTRHQGQSHQLPQRSPRSISSSNNITQEKSPASEKYSPRQNYRGKDQHSPRKSPRRSGDKTHSHKQSPPDSSKNEPSHPTYQGDSVNEPGKAKHLSNAYIHANKPHPAKPSHRGANKSNTGPVLTRGRQVLAQRKTPDKSSTWPGPAPPIHLLAAPSVPTEELPQTESSPSAPFLSPHPPSAGADSWDPTCTDDGILFYESPSLPFNVPHSVPSTRSPPASNRTSPRGQNRGRGYAGASQPISIKQNNQRHAEGFSSHTPTRWGSVSQSAATSFSECSEPLMPMMDASPSSSYVPQWQEDDTRTSDLIFGVSPTSSSSYGRGSQIGSYPHGGIGEFPTPPRFHYMFAGGSASTQWTHSGAGMAYSPHHHSSMNHQYHPHHQHSRRGDSGDITNLTHRFAASSIDSIDADSATDNGPSVND